MVLLGAFLDKINVKSEENAMKNRVKELRDAKHLTQTGLALKVGSTQQTISIGTNRNKKRKCNIRKTNFLISGANICKRNCHVK